MVADSLGLERGMSKEETGAEHLKRNDYILLKQKKELNELKEQTEEAQNDLQTAIDDCNLLQAEKEYARERPYRICVRKQPMNSKDFTKSSRRNAKNLTNHLRKIVKSTI